MRCSCVEIHVCSLEKHSQILHGLDMELSHSSKPCPCHLKGEDLASWVDIEVVVGYLVSDVMCGCQRENKWK